MYEPYNERVRRGGRMRERPGQNRSGGGDLGRNRARPKPPGDGKWTSSCKSSVGAAALGGLSSGTGRGPVRGFYAGEGLCPGLSAGSPASLGKRAGTKARPYRRYDRCKVPVPTLILRNKCVNRHGQKIQASARVARSYTAADPSNRGGTGKIPGIPA